MVKGFWILVFVTITNCLPAQQLKKNKIGFGSQISAGLIEGQQNTSFHIETINGLRYKTWFGGIGAGLDNYYLRTVPVYFSGAKFFSPRNNSFYVQGDAGVNFPWPQDQVAVWNEVDRKYKPGLYYNGSVGFATGLAKNNSILFGLGYSYKFLKEIRETSVWCINPPCENQFEVYKYNLNRLTVRLGWQFNYSR